MTVHSAKTDSNLCRQEVSKDSSSSRIIRVLVVDDHPIVREGICRTVERENNMIVCGEAASAPEAMAILEKQHCDLAVVDISIEGRSGIDLLKEMRSRSINCPIIILTVHDDVSYAERALRAGASGYILKQTGAKQIAMAMRRVLAGEVFVDEKIADKLISGLVGRPRGEPGGSPVTTLSDRELEVLEAIGSGQGTRDIANSLCLGVSTVETYKANIKNKLNLKNAAQLAVFAARWFNELQE
jgi:DNA-binding NarL/FixJ family response regulator